MHRVLVVDDEPAVGEALIGLLQAAGHRADWVDSADAAVAAVKREPTDLALVDLRLGADSGLDLIPRLKELRPEMSVVVITALATIDSAVEAMRLGADNFIPKPVNPERLLAIIDKGLEAEALRRQVGQLERLGGGATAGGPALVAESAAMREAVRLAEAVAPRATTVLLLGETGTGKGKLARLVHDLSPRAGRPFVQLNCAGLNRELTESELFGHEKGAFTGAAARKLGLFEAAQGSTLFLDEVGEMDVAVQAKLLKVLEEQRFRRLGGLAEVVVDVRVIAATHRDLAQSVAAGSFRADLYYRLNVFSIRLPPLRERRDEILPLAQRFLGELGAAGTRLSDEAGEILAAYGWPGNVRELRNVMERAVILCPPGRRIEPEQLPELVADEPEEAPPKTLLEAERRFLVDALEAHEGNIQRTARAIGVTRGLLYRKLQKHGLPPR